MATSPLQSDDVSVVSDDASVSSDTDVVDLPDADPDATTPKTVVTKLSLGGMKGKLFPDDQAAKVAGAVGGAAMSVFIFFVVSFILYVGISSWSSRGMGKRYVYNYAKPGSEKMSTGQFGVWTLETFANGITGGILGVIYDLMHKHPGPMIQPMPVAVA